MTNKVTKKTSEFKEITLKAIKPDFDSRLNDLIMELESLRDRTIRSDLPASIFFQLKTIFHILESVETNNFEGNPTTLAEFIETKINNNKADDNESIEAIKNTEEAIEYIEKHLQKGEEITTKFIREIHSIVVKGLTPLPDGEGSKNPGGYKKEPNEVGKHVTPPPALIESYMNELEDFINTAVTKKYELIYTAIAHHRFVWIHPFDNGNGRVVRLLTYAMLIKQGIISTDVKMFRVINPTGIFGNKKIYSDLLSKCDNGDEKSLEDWCEYVLVGIAQEISKIDKLLDPEYTKSKILIPAIHNAFERHYIEELEYKILIVCINKMEMKLEDIKFIFPEGTVNSKITYTIKKLKDRGILVPTKKNARTYNIGFSHNEILRSIIQMLRAEGFTDM